MSLREESNVWSTLFEESNVWFDDLPVLYRFDVIDKLQW